MLEIKVVKASKSVVRQLDFLKVHSKEEFYDLEILGKVKASVVENDRYYHHCYLLATDPDDGITWLVNLPRNTWGIEETNKHRLIVLV
jgi:hypothetical protein